MWKKKRWIDVWSICEWHTNDVWVTYEWFACPDQTQGRHESDGWRQWEIDTRPWETNDCSSTSDDAESATHQNNVSDVEFFIRWLILGFFELCRDVLILFENSFFLWDLFFDDLLSPSPFECFEVCWNSLVFIFCHCHVCLLFSTCLFYICFFRLRHFCDAIIDMWAVAKTPI